MTSTLIPLSRGAMLDLEALMNGLTDSLNDASTSTSSVCWSPRTGFPATPMSGCSHSPANQPATAKPMRAGYGAASAAASTEAAPPHTHSVKVPPLLSVEVLTAANGVAGSSANADRAQLASDHPALVGGFVDVFRDPFTTSWRLIDKMLYLVWWAYCPRSCVECGLQEAWIPSADCGMKCRGCGRGGRLLETKTAVENSHDDSGDEGEDDAMEQPDDGAAGADAGVEHSLLRGTVQSFMTFHKVVDCIGDLLPGYACTTSGEDNDQDHAFLPRGKELAVVFRAAHDLASLIALPGLPITALPMVQHTALYLSLVLHRFVVPFPLFVLAVQYSGEAAAGSRRRKQSNKHAPGVLDCTAEYVVQWVDVEHAAEQLGINLADFFEAPQVSAQYLQNVMTVARDYAVPSVLWRLDRVPGRVSYVSGLQTKRREVMPGCTGLSPEHTAILVALELARQLDESPMTTTFIEDEEAASRQAVRLGKWLKDLGMYPTCDFYSGENSSGTAATADPTYQRLVELVSGPSGRDRRNAKDEEVRNMLTTPASSFAGSMELVLASPCANALLHLFAQVFQIPVLELAELALHSGIYQGPSFFVSILERSMMEGRYSIMPLVRRISPLVSPWKAVYDALHSQDRLPLITALQLLRRNENSYGPNFHLLTRALHTLLAPHQVGPIYQFNYALLVSGEVFVLTSVVANGVAVFMNVPACTKTISFNAHNRRISVCESNGHSGAPGSGVEKVVDRLDAIFHPPVVVHAVGESVRCIAEVIRCGSTEVTGSSGVDQWKKAVALMEACGRLRRQMRVPILAARLEAVSSIRSSRATSSWGGADVGLTASPSAALIGWGSVDTALTTAMHVDVCRIRAEIQETVCNLPSASLLLGLSDERVVCLYTSLVSLLEFLVSKLAAQEEQQQASADAQDRVPLSWVEELLFVEEDDEDDDDGFPMNSQGSGYAFNRSPRQRPMPMRGSNRSGRTRSPERRGAMALLNSPPQFAKMTPVMKPKSSGVTISSLPMLDELDELPPMALDSSAADVKEESAPMHVDAQKEADALHALVLQHMPPPPPYEEVLCGARRKEKRGNKADMESASRPAEVADFAVFGLRNAQECRRRLQRIYAFLVQYKTKKASLYRKFQSAGAGGSTSRRRSSNSPPQDQVRGVGTKSPGKGSPQVHPSPVEVSVRQPRKKTGRRRRRHANDAQWLAEHGGRDEDSSVSAGSSRGSSSERERVEADPPQGRSPPRTPTMEPRRVPGRGGKRKRGDETQ